MPEPLRVAYTLEQCWHPVPGGTATAALRTAGALASRDDVELIGVAGRHRRAPDAAFTPPVAVRQLPIGRPWLYETWQRFGRPRVETVTGPIDVCHSTTTLPAATTAPHVVTVHDVAFVHTPERFTRHGARVMRAGLERCRRADLVMCPSQVVADDLTALGFGADRLRVVPWGVDPVDPTTIDAEAVRRRLDLPERFVLFVGTVEPRKNLDRLVRAMGRLDERIPLVIVGAAGWGDAGPEPVDGCTFLGFVPDATLHDLYAVADVLAYPSLEEGFGLPVLEAMAHGLPVVTSRGTATEEVAAGAAVLVDPTDVDSIAAGIDDALDAHDRWALLGRQRAAACTWASTAAATVAVYREVAPS
ncbi:MAG: glycosyltransferase family 1 protein [Ilumatobacteraceae bacterium]